MNKEVIIKKSKSVGTVIVAILMILGGIFVLTILVTVYLIHYDVIQTAYCITDLLVYAIPITIAYIAFTVIGIIALGELIVEIIKEKG